MRVQHSDSKGTNGHTNGHGKSTADTIVETLSNAVHVVLITAAMALNFLTVPIEILRKLLGPVVDSEPDFKALLDVNPALDPGSEGAVSLVEAGILGTIIQAAKDNPEAFGVRNEDKSMTYWDTKSLEEDLERFMLLRGAAQSSFIEKANVASRVIGGRLRAEILGKYHKVRFRVDSDAPLAKALSEALTHFGHASQVKQDKDRAEVKAKTKADRDALRIQRRADMDARDKAREQARLLKQQAKAQSDLARGKK